MRIKKYYKLIRVDYSDTELFRITNTDSTSGTFTITKGASAQATNKALEYSTDGVNWTSIDMTQNFTLSGIPAGGHIYMRGNCPNGLQSGGNSEAYAYKFSMDANHSATGNIMSLIDKDNYPTMTTLPGYGFMFLFKDDAKLTDAGFNIGAVTSLRNNAMSNAFRDCTSLTSAPDLSNVTSLESYAMSNAFRDCTSLTSAPDLSNVTSLESSAMSNAFQGCTSLTSAPDLSNVTSLGNTAMQNAFKGCTSLTAAPDMSSVTSLVDDALSYAFQGCTSLTAAPDLSSVTSLVDNALSYAFNGCTSLTAAPDLSNVTSLGNNAMASAFQGCTSLTSAPDLSNVTSLGNNAMASAFINCSKLQTIYVPNVDTWDTSKFNNWVSSAGSQAATPKQMIFQTQALLDACPSGYSGYGNYTKVLA